LGVDLEAIQSNGGPFSFDGIAVHSPKQYLDDRGIALLDSSQATGGSAALRKPFGWRL
jgi:hypothetical protein